MFNKSEQNRFYDKQKRNLEAKKFYNSTAWKKCRALVLERDNHLCQECLERIVITPADMVHHKIHFIDDPSKGLVLDNLISLCNACHNKEHPEKSGGKKKKELSNKIKVINVKANVERV